MKYINQASIIFAVSAVAEVCNYLIPLPIPASIYGILLLLVCLLTGVVRLDMIQETSSFFIVLMPITFIPGIGGIVDRWHIIRPQLGPYLLTAVVTAVLVLVGAGLAAQFVISREKARDE